MAKVLRLGPTLSVTNPEADVTQIDLVAPHVEYGVITDADGFAGGSVVFAQPFSTPPFITTGPALWTLVLETVTTTGFSWAPTPMSMGSSPLGMSWKAEERS